MELYRTFVFKPLYLFSGLTYLFSFIWLLCWLSLLVLMPFCVCVSPSVPPAPSQVATYQKVLDKYINSTQINSWCPILTNFKGSLILFDQFQPILKYVDLFCPILTNVLLTVT